MARVLARPIKTLSSRIKSVAAGNLDLKIRIRMRDDIGELIRSFNDMTKKLKRARERERLSAIGEAVTWITHELKNSFVSIKSFIQLFPQRYKDERFVDKFRKLVPEEINRMERMFKDLSDFSSYSELRITKTNVKEVIDSILEIMREEFTEKKINIKYNSQNANFHIEADPERLKQVFMNLVINSINAMPEGGLLTVSIEFVAGRDFRPKANQPQLESSPTYIEVRITDTGKGVQGKFKRNYSSHLYYQKWRYGIRTHYKS